MKLKEQILAVVSVPLCALLLYTASYLVLLSFCGYVRVNNGITPLYPFKKLETFFKPVSYAHHRIMWKWEAAAEARRFRGTVCTIVSSRDLLKGHVLKMEDLAILNVPKSSVRGIAFVLPDQAASVIGKPLVRPVSRHTPLKWNDFREEESANNDTETIQ